MIIVFPKLTERVPTNILLFIVENSVCYMVWKLRVNLIELNDLLIFLFYYILGTGRVFAEKNVDYRHLTSNR